MCCYNLYLGHDVIHQITIMSYDERYFRIISDKEGPDQPCIFFKLICDLFICVCLKRQFLYADSNSLFHISSATFYALAIFDGGGVGGHIASPLSVRTSLPPYVRKMVSGLYVLNTLVYWIHISYTCMKS